MVYTKMFYKTKLKASFDAIWKDGLQNTVPVKQRVNWCQRFTREHLLKESEEVKREVRERCEAENAEAMAKWKGRLDWSGSPDEYAM